MKKETSIKMNNKGFSLVELIIVIAIMAVLIGILAPQFLKYVEKSRISTDVTNAQQIASTASAAYSDGLITTNIASLVNATTVIPGDALTSVPKLKSNKSGHPGNYFYLTVDAATGAVKVFTASGGTELYPNLDPSME